jgi:D-alanine-D-alanine ligase-like ATP-grasp enzyme
VTPAIDPRFTYALARRGGRLGRTLAPGLDLALETGVRSLLRRRRDERKQARQNPKYRVNLRIWSEAARACGGSVRELGSGFFEIAAKSARVRVWMQVTPLDDEVALRLALDKAATHLLLREAGLAIPEHAGFELSEPGPALRRLEMGGAWVVKPAEGAGSGHGTTTGVRTEADLLRAIARAARGSRRLLVERQLPGEEYRLLLLDGELLGAVRRSPPTLVGDGVSSVAELVHAENRRRFKAGGEAGVTLITLDLDALLALAHESSGPHAVPPAGATVRVKAARSQAGSRDSETVATGAFAAELLDEARAAAAALSLRLAGVDLITSDPGRSLGAAGGGIIEVNGTPGLHYHYLVRDPATAVPVAVPILAKMLEAARE